MLKEVRICLGSKYRIFYDKLGYFEEPEQP